MDSLASVKVPALGYGIRYEFGIFDQVIRDGWQCERTDKWLRNGNPRDISRSEIAYEVKFGGRTETWMDDQGRFRARWKRKTMFYPATSDRKYHDHVNPAHQLAHVMGHHFPIALRSYTRSSSTSPFFFFQLVDACVNLLRLKSFNDMFGTIFQASPKVRMGNELIRPFWTP